MSSFSSNSDDEVAFQEIVLADILPNCGKIFHKVPESSLQVGDIVIFPMDFSSTGSWSSIKHASVCCGDGEVIHFQKKGRHSEGRIVKEGLRAMKRVRGKCTVIRKNTEVDLEDFKKKVRRAMNSTAQYSFTHNNCVHFVLYLLDLRDFRFCPNSPEEDRGQGSRAEEMSLMV